MAIFGNGDAILTNTAGRNRRPAIPIGSGAIEAARDNAGGCRLSNTPGPGKHKSMGKTSRLQCIGERLYHRLMADQLIEC